MKMILKPILAWAGVAGLLAGCAPSQYKPLTTHPTVIPASPAIVEATNAPIADLPVRAASLELTRTAPTDGLVCDPIPMTLTVSNSGGSVLTGVRILDTLPKGLTRDDQDALTFEAGELAPGATHTFKYNAHAVSAGQFTSHAKVTASEGVSAEAAATTTIHQPVLAITGTASAPQLQGRKLAVTYTIANTGDAPATDAILSIPIPAGLTVDSLSDNGQYTGGIVTWYFNAINVKSPQNVSATFNSVGPGDYQFIGTVKADCAADASAHCETKVIGLAAISLQKWDSPDPIAVGDLTTYTVKVVNQGSAADANIAISVQIAPELAPVGSDQPNTLINGQTVTFPVVATLPAQHAVIYTIVAKGVRAGDGHTKFSVNSAALKSALSAEESTTVY